MDDKVAVPVFGVKLEMDDAFAQVVDVELVAGKFKASHVTAVFWVVIGREHREYHIVEHAVDELVIVLVVELIVGDSDIGAADVAGGAIFGIDGF